MIISYELALKIAHDFRAGSIICLNCQEEIGRAGIDADPKVRCPKCKGKGYQSYRTWVKIFSGEIRVVSPIGPLCMTKEQQRQLDMFLV